jgi:hypothetical protein
MTRLFAFRYATDSSGEHVVVERKAGDSGELKSEMLSRRTDRAGRAAFE